MNKILCFDVSGNSTSVAINIGQEVIAFEQELRAHMQAERLIVIIENVLLSAHLKYKDIDYLAVTTGPGSFTGVRIGLAAAYGIAYASGIKSIGITNFEAAYYRLKRQVTKFDYAFIILDAYRNQQYVQIFGNNGYKSDPILADNDKIKAIIDSYAGVKVCTGSGTAAIYNEIKNSSDLLILPRFKTIKAHIIARLADDMINQGILSAAMEPLYIRPPDAVPAV